MQDAGLPLLHALHVHGSFIETAVALLPLFLPCEVCFPFFPFSLCFIFPYRGRFSLQFYLFYIMLTVRSCNDCGRRMRLSSSIQPPKCPACRLADLRPITDTRPYLRCQVPLPTGAPNPLCVNCQYAPISCLYCRSNLVHRRGVTYCSNCNIGRPTVVLPAVDFGPIYSTSFNPSVNSFQSASAPQRKQQRLNLPSIEPSLARVGSSRKESCLVKQALGFLCHEYDSRAHASLSFPDPVTDPQIRLSVARFETELAIAAMDTTCSSCGRLVYTTETRRVFAGDPLLLSLKDGLDSCGWSDGCWNICCSSPRIRSEVRHEEQNQCYSVSALSRRSQRSHAYRRIPYR